MRLATAVAITFGLWASVSLAQGFKFSNEDTADKAREMETWPVCRRCWPARARPRSRTRKILVLIGEQQRSSPDRTSRSSPGYMGRFLRRPQRACRHWAWKTFTQEQIKAQIAQAEIDAYFKNGPDGALAASKKHAANFYALRGLISTQTVYNTLARVNQVVGADAVHADRCQRQGVIANQCR